MQKKKFKTSIKLTNSNILAIAKILIMTCVELIPRKDWTFRTSYQSAFTLTHTHTLL